MGVRRMLESAWEATKKTAQVAGGVGVLAGLGGCNDDNFQLAPPLTPPPAPEVYHDPCNEDAPDKVFFGTEAGAQIAALVPELVGVVPERHDYDHPEAVALDDDVMVVADDLRCAFRHVNGKHLERRGNVHDDLETPRGLSSGSGLYPSEVDVACEWDFDSPAYGHGGLVELSEFDTYLTDNEAPVIGRCAVEWGGSEDSHDVRFGVFGFDPAPDYDDERADYTGAVADSREGNLPSEEDGGQYDHALDPDLFVTVTEVDPETGEETQRLEQAETVFATGDPIISLLDEDGNPQTNEDGSLRTVADIWAERIAARPGNEEEDVPGDDDDSAGDE